MSRRWAVVAAAVLLAGCTSTTGGTGAVSVASSATSGGTDFPASPATSGALSPSGVPSSAPPTAAASGSPAPSECARESDCTLVKSWDVGGGYVVAAFSASSAAGGIGSSILLLARGRTPVFWHVFAGENPSELLCKVAGTLRNCALVDVVGAHGASAYPFVVVGDQLAIGPSIGTDTPGLHVADLNGDLLVDAYGLQNDFDPDYASGHVQWQTWKRSLDGMTLVSTGCGKLAASAPVDPTAFEQGKCKSS